MKPITVSLILTLLSQVALLILAVWVVIVHSGSDSLLAGGCLFSCCLTNIGLLCWSIVEEQSIRVRLVRAVSLSSSCIGLTLVLVEALQASQETTPVLVCGAVAFFVSCAALMCSVHAQEGWQARREPRVSGDPADQPNSSLQELQEPLLNGEERINPDCTDGDVEEQRQQTGYNEDELPPTSPVMETTTSRWTGTSRLLQLAAPQVVYLYAGCAVLLLRLPFSLSIPHFVSTTISAVQDRDFDTVLHEILYLILAGSIDAALDFWCVFLFGYANLRIVRGVRLDLFHKLLGSEVSFFDETSSGELSSRLQSDCSEMAGDLTWFFRFSIESVVRICGITMYMFVRCPLLASCALSIAPVVAVVNKLYGNWLGDNASKVQTALADASTVALEALANIRTVIAYSAEPFETQRYEDKIQDHYRLNVKQLFMTGVYYMVISTFLVNTVVQALLLFIGSRLVQAGRLTPQVLLAFMLYQGQLQNEMLNLFQSYSSLIKSSGAGDKVFQLLDRKPPAPSINSESVVRHFVDRSPGETSPCYLSDPTPDSPSNRQPYNVELKNLSFTYPSRPHQKVLKNLDLVLPPGRSMAIVGSSGSGKSTICHLLQRFYDPGAGSILVDGVDLKQLDLIEYRRHIGVVTQEPTLFRGTVLENITYGSPGATMQNAVHAARLAYADEFIRSFPDGYDTMIGERGVQLSGGQRQRIALARAVIKSPSLLLLDEATSALDSASEIAVQEALDQLLKEHSLTTVIVAHRLRTVQRADCIAVLQQGEIVELGTHEALLRKPNGVYRDMVERAGTSGMLPDEHGGGMKDNKP